METLAQSTANTSLNANDRSGSGLKATAASLPAARKKKARAVAALLRNAPARRVTTNRGRKAVAEQEAGQLAAVLSNTAFQADPFAAIQAHLKLTLPEAAVDSTSALPAAAQSASSHKGTARQKARQR